ncbi:MAG: cytochrome c biogenesis protein CcdA [Actinobacteria bacterium]|nr:cytochrome c biogenesis protein CcdA [Actinomycetota bacterium]
MIIESLSLSAVGLAFAAGLVSFLSPCVLPLLPVYLSYVSGVSVEQLDRQRWAVLPVALAFVLGFTSVFVLLGAGAGGVGSALLRHRDTLTVIAGAFLILSGVAVAGRLHLRAVGISWAPRAGGAGGAFLAGAAVAIAWTPCVGYVLGAILTLASTQSAAAGALLLFVYSLGLGLPFMAAAAAFGWVSCHLARIKRHYRTVQLVAGGLLVVLGVLFVTGTFDVLSRALARFNPFDL